MFELSKFVSDALTREDLTPKCCPLCGGDDIVDQGTATTLVGVLIGGPRGDPNHVTTRYECNGCQQRFTHERRKGYHWLVRARDKKVVAGAPACYEHYVYSHVGCGGDVVRTHVALDGRTPVAVLTTVIGGERKFRTFFTCHRCNVCIETDHEYIQEDA